MLRRVASFDLGSNSSLMWIGDVLEDGTLKTVLDLARVTGLGRGLYKGLPLRADAKARVTEALEDYRSVMERYAVEKVYAVGTAAWREAFDGPHFAEEAGRVLGHPIEVVTGKREAQLTWLGVTSAFSLDRALAVCDPGGLSTELMWGVGDDLEGLTSLTWGTLNCTTEFLKEDPPTPESLTALREQLRESLSWIPIPFEYAHTLVGVSATATCYASMALELSTWAADRVEGFRLSQERLAELVAKLATLDLEARMEVPGLDPLRADVIVAGGLILGACMELVQSPEVVVSNLGLRHGRVREAYESGTLNE